MSPKEVDQDAVDKATTIDLAKPPMKDIPYRPFPKSVFLHPKKDKSKEHRTKVVRNQEELDQALKEGWVTKPHIPEAPADPELVEFQDEYGDAPKAAQPARPAKPAFKPISE